MKGRIEPKLLRQLERLPVLVAIGLVGAGLRAYLVLASEGTLDVAVWEGHAKEILDKGLLAYYRGGQYQLNHPPPACWGVTLLYLGSHHLGGDFSAWLRAPFAVLDATTLWLVLRSWRGEPRQRLIAALFWLHPLAILLSSYHGNTDTGLLPFLVASALAVQRGRAATAGAILGAALWLKLPAALAGPALVFALPRWRERFVFAGAAGAAALLGFAPALLLDAGAVVDAVLLYTPLRIQTTAGVPVWGILSFFPNIGELPWSWRPHYQHGVRLFLQNNNLWILLAVTFTAFAWRGRPRGIPELWGRLGASYTLVYGLTNFWAFQYFAWSLPFLLAMRPALAWGTNVAASLYLAGLYTWLCGNPWLLGTWDFLGKPHWPGPILALRDGATLVFFASALWILGEAATRVAGQLLRRGGGEDDAPTSAGGSPTA